MVTKSSFKSRRALIKQCPHPGRITLAILLACPCLGSSFEVASISTSSVRPRRDRSWAASTSKAARRSGPPGCRSGTLLGYIQDQSDADPRRTGPDGFRALRHLGNPCRTGNTPAQLPEMFPALLAQTGSR